MSNPTREGAKSAARIYLDGKRERTLKQCIAIAAKEHSVTWESIAHYLSGVGARAILDDEMAEPWKACANALSQIAQFDGGLGDLCHRDSAAPAGWLTHGMVWDCADALAALEASGFVETEEEL